MKQALRNSLLFLCFITFISLMPVDQKSQYKKEVEDKLAYWENMLELNHDYYNRTKPSNWHLYSGISQMEIKDSVESYTSLMNSIE